MSTLAITQIFLLSLLSLGLGRLDTLTTTDYLSISVDCKDTRIKVESSRQIRGKLPSDLTTVALSSKLYNLSFSDNS